MKIENDLAVLPSHDKHLIFYLVFFCLTSLFICSASVSLYFHASKQLEHIMFFNYSLETRLCCQEHVEQEWPRVDRSYSGVKGSWQQKWRTILASAHALYLDLLSCVWLCISGGLNCCQEFRRGVVYIDRNEDRTRKRC